VDWSLYQDTEEEESVITYPHLRILPITSADNARNISPQFTRLNIRSSAHPQIRQRIFNCTDMLIMHFILDKILKLLTYYTPFCH